MNVLTWHDGDGLEGAQDAERPESGEVPHFDERGEVAREDDREVQPVPRVAEVSVIIQNESSGDALDRHLHRVNRQENVPDVRKMKLCSHAVIQHLQGVAKNDTFVNFSIPSDGVKD